MVERFIGHIRVMLKGLFLLGLTVVIVCRAGFSLAGSRDEYAVKAAFILNFILLTDWPEDLPAAGGGTIDVCVVGFKNVPRSIQDLNGRKVRERTLRVVPNYSGAIHTQCQVIFYGAETGTDTLVRSLTAVRSLPVLTIGDNSKVTRLGGAIHFYKEKDRLRFAINPKVVSQQGLKMSSRVLQIATLIYD